MAGGAGETLTDAQRQILTALSAAMADRLAAMGENDSGLYRYYVRKLRHQALLGECDLRALEMLRALKGDFRRVWEIGPGVGQLTAMLALDGYDVIAMDHDQRRHAAMLAMLDVLGDKAPAARARVEARFGSFPNALKAGDDVAGDAVVVLGCTFTADAAHYRAFEEAFSKFRFGVIDFARLFVAAPDADAWRKRAVEFSDRHELSVRSARPYRIPEEDTHGEVFLIGG